MGDYLTDYFDEAGIDREFSNDDTIVIGPLGYFEDLEQYLSNSDDDM